MNTLNLINVLKQSRIINIVKGTSVKNDFLYKNYNAHFQNIISFLASKKSGFLDSNTPTLVQKTNYQIFSNIEYRLVI